MRHRWLRFALPLFVIVVIVWCFSIYNGSRNAVQVQSNENERSPAYLMAYFRSGLNQTQMDLTLHYAFSRDGLHWYELNDNKAVWKTPVGAGVIRDPFISKGPDGTYHLVYTMNSAAGTAPEQRGKQFGYARSKDLITFTNPKALAVMESFPNSTNVWAPEWNWDAAGNRYMIHWSSTLGSDKADNNRIYKSYTTDWETFTPAELLFDPGYSVIDSHISFYNEKYYLFFKDEKERPMRNRLAISNQLDRGYGDISLHNTPYGTEATETLQMAGQQKWYLYYDYWAGGKYGMKESSDLVRWSPELPKDSFRIPYQARHATFFPISEEELMQLMRRFSMVARYPIAMGEAEPLQFDGKQDGIPFSAQNTLIGSMRDPFALRTVSLRINPKGTRKTQLLYDEGGVNSGLAIKLEDGQVKAVVTEGGVRATVSAELKKAGSWRHVTVVFAEGNFRLYIDGRLVNQTTASFKKVGAHEGLGGLGQRFSEDAFGDQGDGAHFEGLMDEIAIYNTPLQGADVRYFFHHSDK
ncbi:hypothetical protein PAESOLCIP111_01287 [Paenibacillus solanacearum]|uniref:Uncharacterized protein n=1 Tax=Paenibacillus solanacearum TaxID=2048548 RepID=A0A916NN44_9BACL|nr:hypothetical protein PAESOLCIP111_01287 [Paenibacillus solanacearum]